MIWPHNLYKLRRKQPKRFSARSLSVSRRQMEDHLCCLWKISQGTVLKATMRPWRVNQWRQCMDSQLLSLMTWTAARCRVVAVGVSGSVLTPLLCSTGSKHVSMGLRQLPRTTSQSSTALAGICASLEQSSTDESCTNRPLDPISMLSKPHLPRKRRKKRWRFLSSKKELSRLS